MWHTVLQYLGISISYKVLRGRRIEAGSFSEIFLSVVLNTQYITLQKNESITVTVLKILDLLYVESYYM
jgi:hypothetical protein